MLVAGTLIDNRREYLLKCVQKSLINELPEDLYRIHGMSSNKVRNLLHNICKIQANVYLEIGCWKGSTFCSALWHNPFAKAYVIDDWSQFAYAREEFHKNVNIFLSESLYDIKVIEKDCFSINVLSEIPDKVNIYFYDGDHEKFNQKRALTHFYPVLADKFIYIVDDFNTADAQLGTYEAIDELGLKIEFMSYLPSLHDADRNNYWNGIGLFLFKK